MKAKFINVWDVLRSSFWFLPALMTFGVIGLSFATIALDWVVQERLLKKVPLVWIGGIEGARQLLSTIAGSMVTVAGVVFSITIVVLALASSQFGPRLLRNFTRDRGNQVVLGTFIATFTYCLLVLRSIHGGDGSPFVPYISVSLGIALALVSVAVLIYFIHHVSVIIQAPTVITMVAAELDEGIDRLFPEKLGQGRPPPKQHRPIPGNFEQQAQAIIALHTGYLQSIDSNGLMRIATKNDLVMKLNYRPGKFIIAGSVLLLAWPRQSVAEQLDNQINDSFILGDDRTPIQDVEFCIDQLVEVAVRALSPGINDPFTAMTCIDRLGAALCLLSEREIPSPYRYDGDDKLRVIPDPVTFAGLTDSAFNQIRQYGRSSAAVTIHLLEIIERVLRHVRRAEDSEALLRQAMMIERGAHELREEWDRDDVRKRYRAVLGSIQRANLANRVTSFP
ncbi:MAG TPA: DUF2254 domain-containing protein [Candidatus Binatia bacterium]